MGFFWGGVLEYKVGLRQGYVRTPCLFNLYLVEEGVVRGIWAGLVVESVVCCEWYALVTD